MWYEWLTITNLFTFVFCGSCQGYGYLSNTRPALLHSLVHFFPVGGETVELASFNPTQRLVFEICNIHSRSIIVAFGLCHLFLVLSIGLIFLYARSLFGGLFFSL